MPNTSHGLVVHLAVYAKGTEAGLTVVAPGARTSDLELGIDGWGTSTRPTFNPFNLTLIRLCSPLIPGHQQRLYKIFSKTAFVNPTLPRLIRCWHSPDHLHRWILGRPLSGNPRPAQLAVQALVGTPNLRPEACGTWWRGTASTRYPIKRHRPNDIHSFTVGSRAQSTWGDQVFVPRGAIRSATRCSKGAVGRA